MLDSDKLRVKLREHEDRMKEILGKGDDASDDEVTELEGLNGKFKGLETRFQSALAVEAAEEAEAVETGDVELDAESREFHEKVLPEVRMADYFTASQKGQSVKGRGGRSKRNPGIESGTCVGRQQPGRRIPAFPAGRYPGRRGPGGNVAVDRHDPKREYVVVQGVLVVRVVIPGRRPAHGGEG